MALSKQTSKMALDILSQLREMGVADRITTMAAYNICQDYDLEGMVYYIQRHHTSVEVRSIDLAVYIARRTIQQEREQRNAAAASLVGRTEGGIA